MRLQEMRWDMAPPTAIGNTPLHISNNHMSAASDRPVPPAIVSTTQKSPEYLVINHVVYIKLPSFLKPGYSAGPHDPQAAHDTTPMDNKKIKPHQKAYHQGMEHNYIPAQTQRQR